MVKKIGVFITILGLFFVGIPQFNSKAAMVIPVDDGTITIGSFVYQQGGSSEIFEIGFSLPLHNTSTYSLGDILVNVSDSFSGLALFTIKQEVNTKFQYQLLNSAYSLIEVMPKFDTIMFLADTNEMIILLNGNTIKTYNNSLGIEYLRLVYTGIYDGTDYESGYLAGYGDGLIDGETTGYADGYTEARRELWTSRYQEGYDEGFDDGEAVGFREGEDIGYQKGLLETDATGFGALLATVFGGLGTLLSIEILPNIHIGAIIAVPLVFGVIFFILGKRKGD